MITAAISARTTQAAVVCEPKNRDSRPSLWGLLRSLMTVNVMIPASTPTANRSSRNPIAAQWPIPGIANVREKRSPYDSMIVSSRTMKPQNVAACAAPGTVHWSSFRCPTTSVSWVSTSPPGCLRTDATRSGAGCPENANRRNHHTRRPASANAAAVSTRPTIIRTSTRNLLMCLGAKPNGVTSDTQESTASGGSRWAAPGKPGWGGPGPAPRPPGENLAPPGMIQPSQKLSLSDSSHLTPGLASGRLEPGRLNFTTHTTRTAHGTCGRY